SAAAMLAVAISAVVAKRTFFIVFPSVSNHTPKPENPAWVCSVFHSLTRFIARLGQGFVAKSWRMVQVCHSTDKVNVYKDFWPFTARSRESFEESAGVGSQHSYAGPLTLVLLPLVSLSRSCANGIAGKFRC
ncbi:MAG: hypothetical protein AB3N13_14430, partial [Arenibacterium sp.]